MFHAIYFCLNSFLRLRCARVVQGGFLWKRNYQRSCIIDAKCNGLQTSGVDQKCIYISVTEAINKDKDSKIRRRNS